MKINKTDLSHSRNMLKALGKGEWKLDGMEILAFAEMMKWFSNLQKAIEMEIAQEEANERARAAEMEKLKAGVIVPEEVQSPIRPMDVGVKKVSNRKKD
jgi:hypothetical protein